MVHDRYQQLGGEDISVASEVEMLRPGQVQLAEYYDDNRRIDRISRLSLALGTLWSRQSYRRLAALIERERPDVVHLHNLFPLISPSAYYACAAEGVPVVQTLRSYRTLCLSATLSRDGRPCEQCLGLKVPWPEVAHACYRQSRGASAVTGAMLVLYNLLGTWRRLVEVHIALTEFARQKFIEVGFAPGRLVVKPDSVYPDPGAGDHHGGFDLFFGRLSQEKGLHTLMAAWDRLGGRFPLRIVGDGPLMPQV